MSTTYLYCRVSTNKQQTDTQEHDLIKRFPEGTVVKETASGVKARPELKKLLETLQKGDTLAVAALDRLGRKLIEILTHIEDLHSRGVNVVSLREGVDYGNPTGRMIIGVLLAVAQLERDLIGMRTSATLQTMKAKGIRIGRPEKHTKEARDKAWELNKAGLGYRAIRDQTGISISRLSQMFRNPVAS